MVYDMMASQESGASALAFGLMAIAITVTAFRGGERWAWWTLLVGNTIALVSAMTYDRTVNAIGPFELSEYLGLAIICGALAITAPFFRRDGRFDRRDDTFRPGRDVHVRHRSRRACHRVRSPEGELGHRPD